MEEILVLSCAETSAGGGLYRCTLDGQGRLHPGAYLACPKPMYAVTAGGRLHVLLRAPYKDSENSGYFSCLPDFSGRTEIQDTNGKCACHLAADESGVYLVNYLSGNVVKNCREVVTHTGAGPNLPRQDMPHTHFVCFSPEGQYVLACDLGLDTVFVYDRDLHEISRARVPAGYGVRHLVFRPDGKVFYAVNELVPSVSTFAWHNGVAECIATTPLPCKVPGATAAAIRYDPEESKLYVSVRGVDRIFVFNTSEGCLKPAGDGACGGRGPRDFGIFGQYIVCTNENSGNATVIDKHTFRILDDRAFACPLCVLKVGG